MLDVPAHRQALAADGRTGRRADEQDLLGNLVDRDHEAQRDLGEQPLPHDFVLDAQ
jgi:hypothetical protein